MEGICHRLPESVELSISPLCIVSADSLAFPVCFLLIHPETPCSITLSRVRGRSWFRLVGELHLEGCAVLAEHELKVEALGDR